MEAIAYGNLMIADEATSCIVGQEATTQHLTQRRTDDEVGEETAFGSRAVEAKPYTEVRSDSPIKERRQVVDEVGIDTEAELVTEQTYIGIWDEVEVGVAELEVSTSTYIQLRVIPEVWPDEERSAIEEEDILCLLHLHFLSIDLAVLLAISYDDTITAITKEFFGSGEVVVSGALHFLLHGCSLLESEIVETIDDLIHTLDQSDIGIYLSRVSRSGLWLSLLARTSLWLLVVVRMELLHRHLSVGATIERIEQEDLV